LVYKEGEINGFGNKGIVAFNFIKKRLSEKKIVKWLYKVRVHGPLGFVKGVGILYIKATCLYVCLSVCPSRS
jgi:hypothetical protein